MTRLLLRTAGPQILLQGGKKKNPYVTHTNEKLSVPKEKTDLWCENKAKVAGWHV